MVPYDLQASLCSPISNQDINGLYIVLQLTRHLGLMASRQSFSLIITIWWAISFRLLHIISLSPKKLSRMFIHTLITLIPKTKHVNNTTNFRPISICSTFYKVITRILANIVKHTLPYIISKAQFAFIKGRDIFDSIDLTQELCGVLNSGIHSKAFCSKINLRKAFDTINRSIILNRMYRHGFSDLFID